MTTMHVPFDVIVEIFSKLPAKSLVRMRWVCKYWFKVITDPSFVKMHLNHVHATNNPLGLIEGMGHMINGIRFLFSVNLMDHYHDHVLHPLLDIKLPVSVNLWPVFWNSKSCNGLLCINVSAEFSEKILIWNPCTKQYKIIWQDTSPNQECMRSYGFGYDRSIDDYKVIRNVSSYNWYNDTGYNGETSVDLYTLGTNSTKKLCNSRFFVDSDNGLFINGDLYWKARLTSSTTFNIIVAFDIAKEEYRQILNPPFCIYNYECDCYANLGKLKGCLCVLYITDDQQSVEVWVMKRNVVVEDMKEEYSWDKLYTISARRPIDKFRRIQLLNVYKNGEIAIMLNNMYLSLYDPKSNQIKEILPGRLKNNKIRDFQPDTSMRLVETYIESLVSIKGGTYMGQEPKNVQRP